jgi:large subunit ribosomal protein L29
MSKASEIREMSDEQLRHELRESQQALFRLRFQSATERIDAPSNLKKLRQTIARIKTIQRQRELAVEEESAAMSASR